MDGRPRHGPPNPIPLDKPARSITEFRAGHFFLSNTFPCQVPFEDLTYPSVDHAFWAARTLDLELRGLIHRQVFPAIARRIGRGAPARPDWDDVEEAVMVRLLRTKFAREDLRGHLLGTDGAELVHGGVHEDRHWGAVHAEGRWIGENRLGILLMRIRDEIRSAR